MKVGIILENNHVIGVVFQDLIVYKLKISFEGGHHAKLGGKDVFFGYIDANEKICI